MMPILVLGMRKKGDIVADLGRSKCDPYARQAMAQDGQGCRRYRLNLADHYTGTVDWCRREYVCPTRVGRPTSRSDN